MSYHQDWIMRQIETICITLGFLLFGKNPNTLQLEQFPQALPGTNPLYCELSLLIRQGKICEAEDLLYEALEEPDRSVLEAAVAFYADLNRFSDEQLQAANFPETRSSADCKMCVPYLKFNCNGRQYAAHFFL